MPVSKQVHMKKASDGFGKLQLEPYLLIILIMILAAGLAVLYSATRYIDASEHPDSPFYTVSRQAVFLLAAFFSMCAISRLDYRRLSEIASAGYIAAVAMSVLVLFFGKEVNGQKRWFAVGPLSFQPAEFAKLMLIIKLSDFFSIKYMESEKTGIIIKAVIITLFLFIPVVSANLSSGLIIAGIACAMTFAASEKRSLFFVLIASGLFLCIFAFKSGILENILDEYQMNRIYAWIDPEEFPLSNGFQVLQGLYAIGAGGIFGAGYGGSLQKLGFLPEAQNDMIFSIICEESGLTGAGIIIVLFILLTWRMMYIAIKAEDALGMFLVTGVMAHIGIQTVLNIAVVTNSIPNTGISLPFISYGGSSVLFLMVEMGIVFSVSNRSRRYVGKA